jgi:transcriptional regulator with XRE-family HTH domain
MAELFGVRLARIRVDRMKTQRRLAKDAGVALSTIVNLEQGHTAPRFDTIHKLARALDIPPHELFKGEGDK